MTPFDLVIRNARVATAADVFDCDIGIAQDRIVAPAQGLPAAPREIDAAGRIVTPGGVDAHCRLARTCVDAAPLDRPHATRPDWLDAVIVKEP